MIEVGNNTGDLPPRLVTTEADGGWCISDIHRRREIVELRWPDGRRMKAPMVAEDIDDSHLGPWIDAVAAGLRDLSAKPDCDYIVHLDVSFSVWLPTFFEGVIGDKLNWIASLIDFEHIQTEQHERIELATYGVTIE